jgi:hypothetical protein
VVDVVVDEVQVEHIFSPIHQGGHRDWL